MQDPINQQEIFNSMITIESIYEQASEIGEHFKKLIELFGSETFETIIPCVVSVLENLEDVTSQRNDCLNLIESLHRQIEQLQNENKKRIEEQAKYQSEIEDIDDLWRKENNKLEQYVKYLKNENTRLSSLRLNEKFSQSLIDLNPGKEEKSLEARKDLNETQIDKLKTRIRILENESELKNEEIQNLKIEKNNLTQENKNLRSIVSMSLNTILDSSDKNEAQEIYCDNINELKDKIQKLEEQLQLYKLKFDEMINYDVPNDNKDVKEEIGVENFDQKEIEIKMEDLPVQGPIPKEPDEKLYWPYVSRKSRIWSFFPRLTKALIK